MITVSASSAHNTLYPAVFGLDLTYDIQLDTLMSNATPLYVHNAHEDDNPQLIYLINENGAEWKFTDQELGMLYATITG